MATGYQAAVPLICLDDDCPYKAKCPLHETGIPRPHMKDCPVESHLFEQWRSNKMLELGIEDPNDPMFSVDMSQINEYAELEILQYRANIEMAMDPETVKEKIIGVDDGGNLIKQDIENPRINIIDKLARSKRGLLDDLLATRKARNNKKGGDVDEGVSKLATLIKAAREWQEKQDRDKINAIDVEITNESTTEQPADSEGASEGDQAESLPSTDSGE